MLAMIVVILQASLHCKLCMACELPFFPEKNCFVIQNELNIYVTMAANPAMATYSILGC